MSDLPLMKRRMSHLIPPAHPPRAVISLRNSSKRRPLHTRGRGGRWSLLSAPSHQVPRVQEPLLGAQIVPLTRLGDTRSSGVGQ